MRYFCTLFDANYLIKGLAMLRSLRQHCDQAIVFVLCMDGQTRELLEKLDLPHVRCISLAEVETPDLLEVKPGRNVAEYCWTLSPCLPWHVLQHHPEVDAITYLDADLYFYSSPQPIFDEIGDASVAIIEHRFPAQFKHMEVRGRFCVEWVGFRRDDEGMACLKRWRDQCIEWCFYRLEDNRMGDQKYLDAWPRDFSSVHIIEHLGAGVAPWNFGQYRFGQRGDGTLTVNGDPLIFYHFHQFQLLSNGRFDRISAAYKVLGKEPGTVYEQYELAISAALQEIRKLAPDFQKGLKSVTKIGAQRIAQALLPRIVKEWLKKFVSAV
ncbi:hypothetical protein [Herbaspirillum robiniae]|uniref:Glycosyl transferase n=1 Tax=Herbaspirillum robiniae TaxID=2014887 RepID=A0A246WP13_9BURK|nr:hypothetical protein [Herbaspirillum robiniae]OWY27291.1 hypothetical protein CEJ42_19745 [Herbaspirillum robiniae]